MEYVVYDGVDNGLGAGPQIYESILGFDSFRPNMGPKH